MRKFERIKKTIISNLKTIFDKAMATDNLSAAIQSQSVLAKIHFLFEKEKITKNDVSLENFTEDDIKKLIQQSQKKLNISSEL